MNEMESTLTTEELLAQHKKWQYVRTDRNGTRYFHDCTCQRCGGRGVIDGYKYIEGGICFECGGSGVSDGETIKVYKPEYAAKLEANRKARAEKAAQERKQKAIAGRATNLAKAGFGKEGDEFVIYRVVGETFSIKDELKAAGARFKPSVGWYFSEAHEPYECQRMSEKDVLTNSIFIDWKDRKEVEPLWVERNRAAAESTSEWQGSVGEHIQRDLHVDRRFESSYIINSWKQTTKYMYLMSDNSGNKYKWSTAKYMNEGEDVHLIGTVKEHAEYKDKTGVVIKQTVLTRCKKVEDN